MVVTKPGETNMPTEYEITIRTNEGYRVRTVKANCIPDAYVEGLFLIGRHEEIVGIFDNDHIEAFT